jgi:Outer membrane protein beta-barrel domain
MIKTTVLATILALALPYAVTAQTVETEEYKDYQVSCETGAACNDFGVTYEETDQEVAQIQRTRRTRSSTQAFENWYAGGGAGIFFGDNLDLGFQGHVFGGTKFNEYIGADLEFTFGFAGVEDIDENITLLGFYLNPRFEYQFENSNLTAFLSPGLGLSRASGFGDSETEFDFQIKTGVSFPVQETTEVYVQGRYQNEAEAFGIEGGAIFDL